MAQPGKEQETNQPPQPALKVQTQLFRHFGKTLQHARAAPVSFQCRSPLMIVDPCTTATCRTFSRRKDSKYLGPLTR